MADTSAAPVAAQPTPTPQPTPPVDVTPPTDAVVTPPVDNKTPEAHKKGNKKVFELKVDGIKEQLELDLDNQEELIKHLQMSKASSKRMQEAAQMRKGIEELIETLRADPLKVISDPRLNIPDDVRKKMAESIINNEIEEMAKTPEQREKDRLQKEYERLKKEVETEKQAREQAEFARLQEQQAVQLDSEISTAIEKSGLPKNARTVRYYAEGLMLCLQNGLDLSAEDLTPFIKRQALGEFKELITQLPDEEFESWLGKDQISRIRKRNMAKAKAALTADSIKQTSASSQKAEDKPKEKVLMKDFFKKLGH